MIKGKQLHIQSKVVLYDYEEKKKWMDGEIVTEVGKIKKVKSKLDNKDIVDGWKVRWGIGRDNYKISPGIYALGNPNTNSPVLVTANYKFTFDKLRKELHGLNLWIMVINTMGINVWCSAGKGTFSEEEIIKRINKVHLKEIISHNTIILPQLSASGVASNVVTKRTGFNAVYGPVRANDIPAFLKNNMEATREMRTVKFDVEDRIALTPLEIMVNAKYIPVILVAFFILNLISPNKLSFNSIACGAILNSLPYIIALLIGSFFVPVLLPYIPFRAFSLKGLIVGILWSFIAVSFNSTFRFPNSYLMSIGNALILTAIISVLSLNFTGSTTYTSLSGVEKETKITFPIAIVALVVGILCIIAYKIFQFAG